MKSASFTTKILTAALLAIMIGSLALPLLNAATPPALPGDYAADYGVLDTDTYILYPYEEESIDIGFSKYGEMINGDVPLGLKYKDVDVFASEDVGEENWNNGWLIKIHWVDSNRLRTVWAYAMYAVRFGLGVAIEGDWKQLQATLDASDPDDEIGARRTSGWCITDPIRTIYDGPRRSIYLIKTTIYDQKPIAQGGQGVALLQIETQIIFNKVKKYVVEIKDIKRLEKSKWTGPFQIEYSQRGEWDIGTQSVCPAWAEFYNNLTTEYEKHPFYMYNLTGYDLCQMISRETGVDLVGFWAFWPNLMSKWVESTSSLNYIEYVLDSIETEVEDHEVDGDTTVTTDNPAISYPRGIGVWSDEPWVFVNGVYKPKGSTTWSYVRNGDNTLTITFKSAQTGTVTVVYKKWAKGAIEHEDHTVGREGYSYGMSSEEQFDVPYVIGEWDFELTYGDPMHSTQQFRCVSVLGVVDYHDALDPDMPGEDQGLIDREAMFQLDEVFNPWDLKDAAHKSTFRWAQKGTVTEDTYTITLTAHSDLSGMHNIVNSVWDEYCSSAERVIVWDPEDGTPYLLERDVDYTIDFNSGVIIFDPDYELWTYKVLYSTYLFSQPPVSYDWDTGRWEWIVVGRDAHSTDSAGAAMISIAWEEWKGKQVWLSALEMKGKSPAGPGMKIPYLLAKFGEGDNKADYYYPDDRLHFMDDWCTPEDWEGEKIWPYGISSSNIIVVGGPLANLAAEYFNDFTDGFSRTNYGTGFYSYACWGRTTQPAWNREFISLDPSHAEGTKDTLWYSSPTETDDVGYAIVSTYKDINGTIGFIVWGTTAEDTYYASFVVRGGLLPWLQQLQPGVTTLILGFDYESLHPVGFHVCEALGTITECSGFDTSFKDYEGIDLEDYDTKFGNASKYVDYLASNYGLTYKLIWIEWCAQLHPDP